MSLRLRCRSCQAAFVVQDDQAGQAVTCPKCDARQVAPQAKAAPIPEAEAEAEPVAPMLKRMQAPPPSAQERDASVFVPKGAREPRRSRKGIWIGLVTTAVLAAALLVAWPSIRGWLDPRPKGAVEGVAYDYLQALARGDVEAERRLSVVAEPPAIRSFRDLGRDKGRDSRTKGRFAPIARLHRQIEKKYVYDPNNARFTPKDPLGPAAETLDALHDAKAKAEKDKTYEKMASGDPEEQMQAAIDFGSVMARLSETTLSPKRLIPSYKMLVQAANPPLEGPELALALDYARHLESWDLLLKRPFPTLKADGPFQYDKAEVTAAVADKLASSGDPPATLRLKLVRFRMDAIDTGWKVVSARRITPGIPDLPEDEDGPEPETPTEPAKPSPGEAAPSPGAIPPGPAGR